MGLAAGGRVLAGSLAVASIVVLGSATGSSAQGTPAIQFATPTVVDPINLFGEPDLRSDPSRPGYWYSSGPWGTGVQRSIWDQSQDGTRTFRELHDLPDPLTAGGSLHGPGGGDTEIANDHLGKFYAADLGALVTQHTTVSTDGGKSFTTQPIPDAFRDPQLSGTDRQWFGLWDPPDPAAVQSAYKGPWPVNYMVYLEAALGSGETVTSSVPNGSDSSQVGLNYACGPGALGTSLCPNWPLNDDGFVFADQLTGKVVQAIDYIAGNNAPDQAAVVVNTPGANGYMTQSNPGPVRHLVYTLNNASTAALFPAIAEDAQRNAYYIWSERPNDSSAPRTARSWQVFYSWSPPGPDSQWDQWSPPIQVSSPPSNTAIMPWAVAGGNGNLDIAWYGTDKLPLNPESDSDPQTAAASWYVYFAQVTHAASSSPHITQVKAMSQAMHHGSICLSGLGCIQIQGNRNLADFFEITTDASGAAYIVYNNTANDLIQQAPILEAGVPEGVVDHKGAEVVMVARQAKGPTLNGGSVDQPTDFGVTGISSRSGDALYPAVNGPNYPGVDITGVSLVPNGDKLEATIKVADLSQLTAAAAGIHAPYIDFFVRWEYKDVPYFALAEIPAGVSQAATFFDGQTQTIDLCSVSACDPHVFTYPGPAVAPQTSHLLSSASINSTAALAQATPGTIVFDIPRSDVGSPPDGAQLNSVGAYSLASLQSYEVPLSNAAAENDQVPVELDGACCFTTGLGSGSGSSPAPVTGTGNGGSPNTTGAPAPPAVGLALLFLGAALLAARLPRWRRFGRS